MVACGVAHVFQVRVLSAGAHALLARGGARVVLVFLSKEGGLELVHPRVNEQQRRVVPRDEGRASHSLVPLAFEVIDELLPDVPAFHFLPYYCPFCSWSG